MLTKGFFVLLLINFLICVGPAFTGDKSDFQFKKQPEIQQVKPKKPVKIKLKRSADSKYTWELTGDDVDEIIKADRRLKNLLKTE